MSRRSSALFLFVGSTALLAATLLAPSTARAEVIPYRRRSRLDASSASPTSSAPVPSSTPVPTSSTPAAASEEFYFSPTPTSPAPASAPTSRPVPAPLGVPEGVSVNSGVKWTPGALAFIHKLRAATPSWVPIHVNSVIRTPESQAQAMVDKYNYAEARSPGGGAADIRNTYGSKAERFLSSRPYTSENWARVVRELRDSGQGFTTGHLAGSAVDVKIRDLTASQVEALKAAVARVGGRPSLESSPPHLHVDRFSMVVT